MCACVESLTCYTANMLPADRATAIRPRKGALSGSGHPIMHGAAYLTTIGVAVAELLNLPLGPRFVLIAALLALFAVMLSGCSPGRAQRRKVVFYCHLFDRIDCRG